MDYLFEHRGKPDPEKARLRQEAHKRGLERHKNALARERQEELKRKARLLANKHKGQQDDVQEKYQQQAQQVLNKQKQQDVQEKYQQQAQQVLNKQKQQALEDIENIKKQFVKNSKELDKHVSNMKKTAPTDNAKKQATEIEKEINDYNKRVVAEYSNMSSQERKNLTNNQKKFYDDIENKYKKKMQTPEERSWFKKNMHNIKTVGVNVFVGAADLMGYKDLWDDATIPFKYVFKDTSVDGKSLKKSLKDLFSKKDKQQQQDTTKQKQQEKQQQKYQQQAQQIIDKQKQQQQDTSKQKQQEKQQQKYQQQALKENQQIIDKQKQQK